MRTAFLIRLTKKRREKMSIQKFIDKNNKDWNNHIKNIPSLDVQNNEGLINQLKNTNFDISGITSGLLDGILGLIGNRIQMNYQKELMNEQHKLNQIASENAFALTEQGMQNQHNRNLQMYNLTQSTQAKVNELEQTGLSVGLLQGTPSQGGASTAGGATAQAGSTGLGSAPQVNLALDIASKQAQIELMKAQAKKTTEEAKGQSIHNEVNSNYLNEITKIGLENLKKQGVSIELQNEYQNFVNEIKSTTLDSEIQGLLSNYLTSYWTSEITSDNARVSRETMEITIASQNTALLQQLEDLKLTQAEISKIENDIKYTQLQYNIELKRIMLIKDENERNRELERWKTEYNGDLTTKLNESVTEIRKEELKLENKKFVKDSIIQGVSTVVDGTAKIMSAMKPVQIQKTVINTGEQKKK